MSELVITIENSNKLIVSFGGHIPCFGGVRFEFNNFLQEFFPEYNRFFYVDIHKQCYHSGINNISNNIDTTVEYLRNKIKDYSEVTFIGHSSGGYAAILFGSLLNVKTVIAFIPQTILRSKNKDSKYVDIKKYINDTTQYHLYGDVTENVYMYHHISHCEYIEEFPNVTVHRFDRIIIHQMRSNGKLLEIFKEILNK